MFREIGIPRTTAWRVNNGTAGVDTAKIIEHHLEHRAEERGSHRNPLAHFREWTALGLEIAVDDPAELEALLVAMKTMYELRRADRVRQAQK